MDVSLLSASPSLPTSGERILGKRDSHQAPTTNLATVDLVSMYPQLPFRLSLTLAGLPLQSKKKAKTATPEESPKATEAMPSSELNKAFSNLAQLEGKQPGVEEESQEKIAESRNNKPSLSDEQAKQPSMECPICKDRLIGILILDSKTQLLRVVDTYAVWSVGTSG